MSEETRLALVAETRSLAGALEFLDAGGLPPAAFECRLKGDLALMELLCPSSVEIHRLLALGAALAQERSMRGVAVVRLRRRGWIDGNRFDREVVASWSGGSSTADAPQRVAA